MSSLREAQTSVVPESQRLDTLMVIVEERLSPILKKGEIVPRYYNPGNLFRHVRIVIASEDDPDPGLVQPMVGDAELSISSFASGLPLFLRSAGWRPFLLRPWAAQIVRLAERVRPQLVRCHGNQWNAFAALEIKRRLGVPYVVSLHGNPDIDYFRGRRATTLKRKILGRAIEAVETLTVRHADFVIPVYSPIVPYLQKHKVERFEVVYNAVGYGIAPRASYAIDRARIEAVCVGRQQSQEKDPSPILDAMPHLPELHLTLVGGGDLHESLRQRATLLGVDGRVTFLENLPNADVLKLIERADLMVYCSHNFEISKGCIEAALAGLPVVVNNRGGAPAAELAQSPFVLVSGSAESYRAAIRRIIDDDAFREATGRAARRHAEAHWLPEQQERRVVEIYRTVAGGRR